jgi:hypothetical protein
MRQREVLAKGQVHGCVPGAGGDITAAATWAERRSVKLGGRIGKDSVNPLLFARTGDGTSMVGEWQVGTVAVTVPVRVGVATAD